MPDSKLQIVKDEPTTGYFIIGKNKEGMYYGKKAYCLHLLFIYMMVCSIIVTTTLLVYGIGEIFK